MNFTDFLKNNTVVLDGGMGTLLQNKGLKTGENTALFNLSNPDIITEIHKSYYDSGSNVVSTNTFGANSLNFDEKELDLIVASAVDSAKKARALSVSDKEKFIALDVGPTGKLLKPYGELDFEDAVNIFKKTISLGDKYGVDLIYIETVNDIYEAKAALIAAKETTQLPVMISCAFDEKGKMMTGATPEILCIIAESLGAVAVGLNCSLGPDKLSDIALKFIKHSSIPVIFKPNAGLPDSNSNYDINPESFSEFIKSAVKSGVRLVGGCCGTTPAYIKAICDKCSDISIKNIMPQSYTVACSYSKTVNFENNPVIIGERINPTGKKKLKEALLNNNLEYILSEASAQEDSGVDCLDVNVGTPGIDEVSVLKNVCSEIQKITNLPLQIDSTNTKALENAVRIYNGKPIINSVNGSAASMEKIFPIAKKYGCLIVALTLDDKGIPESSEERLKIAENIIAEAAKYGINKKDIIFDALTTTVATDPMAALKTLDTINLIKNKIGCKTVLGISNISFGLPERVKLNAAFLIMAFSVGLSSAIVNPCVREISECVSSFKALTDMDPDFSNYISNMQNTIYSQNITEGPISLQQCIIKGLSDKAVTQVNLMLQNISADDIINDHIIPALDKVGRLYENGTIFLPGLLAASDAAKSSFDKIKSSSPKIDNHITKRIVIATVKGDVHDLGKNIVRMLLENYGFTVYDLGKDVDEYTVLEAAKKYKADYIGLSALMTTTLSSMERTVKLVKKEIPDCKTIVGGAVVTQEYSDNIGADCYARDAMATVNYVSYN